MQTNFFQQLTSLHVEGDWNITIKTSASGRVLVSVLLNNDKTSDNAKKRIPPLILKGTIQEMDEGFFNAIRTPVQKTAELFANMDAYAKAQEEARQQSKMQQDKANQSKKEKEGANKKYEAALKKVQELEEAGKYREAYAQLPKAEEFPDHQDEIADMKEELSQKFEQPSLF
jgi:PRTRC genetic system protein E